MPDPHSLPDDVQRLLDERSAARERRDWQRADALRDELAALGWEAQDSASGSTARPILAQGDAAPLPVLLDDPASVALSLQVVADDHPDDLARFLAGLAAHPPSEPWELVVVANAPSFALEPALASVPLPVEPQPVPSAARLGWADARTLGLGRSRGEVTVLLDTSLEPVGDAWAPLLAAFEHPEVGIAGGWGVTSDDLRLFTDAPPGEVDAIEAYCLAVRRAALRAVGGFDRRFQWYRNADLDFSFAVRDAGWKAVRTEPLPFVRHEHRGWEALPEAERDRLSKRNFYRFLDRWGDRRDLLVGGRDA
ncbi:MAG TPA: glycosyltransferase [Candidatus Limnocylindria bacterium]|nr:glycosyltransferase [Candidatus Limnocylindria bacterium]